MSRPRDPAEVEAILDELTRAYRHLPPVPWQAPTFHKQFSNCYELSNATEGVASIWTPNQLFIHFVLTAGRLAEYLQQTEQEPHEYRH